ncbi:MAG: site-specific integrase [Patulibacter minatonensis]
MSVEARTRADGTTSWVVRWRVDGQPKSKSFSEAKLGKKAEKLAHKFDLEVTEQLVTTGVVVVNRGAMTINRLWPEWFDAGCQDWTPPTQDAYASAMDLHVLPYFGRRQVAAITPAEVEQWTAKLKRDGVGPSAVRKAVTAFSSLMSYAVRARQVDINPVQVAKKPAAPREREPVKITPDQVEMLRAWFLWQGLVGDAMLISLLAYAGPRPTSEALVLDWRNVSRSTITVLPNRKRGARRRLVDILDPLGEDLMEWRKRQGRLSGLVFPYGDGGVSIAGRPWTTADWDSWRERRWSAAVAAVGLPGDTIPRDLRGSFATLLIRSGRDIISSARQCGHKPSTFLDVYAGEFEGFDPTEPIDPVEKIRDARIIAAACSSFGEDVLRRHVADPAARRAGSLLRIRSAAR